MADKKTTPEPSGLEPGPPAYNSDESDGSTRHREVYAYTEDRKIGITGAVFLILNKMIGTGIFSTPSGVFAATGSVGISLMLWVIGGILTMCGISVFLEFGLAIPRSGGEKNYLERVYRHPKYLATCVLASQMILLGFSSGNSLAFGRYVLFASGSESPDGWAARGIAVACATFATFLHAVAPKWGLRLINVLGVFKVVILLFIVFSGFAALAGHRRVPDPDNFSNAFRIEEGDGYGNGGAYGYATALLRVVYSYKGWENANYVVGELKDPKRTLSIAAPLAVVGVTILYVLANIAYFAAIPKGQLATSEALVAGVYFRNMFGDNAGTRVLPVFVCISNLGNVLAVSFAHARLNQEFAKEGLLPFSRFWASNRPFNAPAAALFLHWIVTVIVLVAPPAGPPTISSSICTPTPAPGSSRLSAPALFTCSGPRRRTGRRRGTRTCPFRSCISWPMRSCASCPLSRRRARRIRMDTRTMFSLSWVSAFCCSVPFGGCAGPRFGRPSGGTRLWRKGSTTSKATKLSGTRRLAREDMSDQ